MWPSSHKTLCTDTNVNFMYFSTLLPTPQPFKNEKLCLAGGQYKNRWQASFGTRAMVYWPRSKAAVINMQHKKMWRAWFRFLPLSVTICIFVGMSCKLCKPQFPQLWKGHKNKTYGAGSIWELSVLPTQLCSEPKTALKDQVYFKGK